MLGKGSVNYNDRKFKAANIDAERTSQNITYCNEPLKEVYHQFFDEALEKYNAELRKQNNVFKGIIEQHGLGHLLGRKKEQRQTRDAR